MMKQEWEYPNLLRTKTQICLLTSQRKSKWSRVSGVESHRQQLDEMPRPQLVSRTRVGILSFCAIHIKKAWRGVADLNQTLLDQVTAGALSLIAPQVRDAEYRSISNYIWFFRYGFMLWSNYPRLHMKWSYICFCFNLVNFCSIYIFVC